MYQSPSTSCDIHTFTMWMFLLLFVTTVSAQFSQRRPNFPSSNRQNFIGGSSGNPCNPSPCGPQTTCSVGNNGRAICKCIPGYFPKPDTITGCGPQCTRNDECPELFGCINQRCEDPCDTKRCGVAAYCDVQRHQAICKCPTGYTGNADQQCQQPLPPPDLTFRIDPCDPSPCGQNTHCKVQRGLPVCSCLFGYEGNPDFGCQRAECIEDEDCSQNLQCSIDLRCVDPCLSRCGFGAECRVERHLPVCFCPEGFTGQPHQSCVRADPCNPSPCGINTECRNEGGRAVCGCIPLYIGDPIQGCRPECSRDTDCPDTQACENQRCVNPCSRCGEGAECHIRNHQANCQCPDNYLGDPHSRCYPECVRHEDCQQTQACQHFRCINPCDLPGTCGSGADCEVIGHQPECSCPPHSTGHPFEGCRPFDPRELCEPNPCGQGATCTPGKDRLGNDRPVCACPEGFYGSPTERCLRGECFRHEDCPDVLACETQNYRCFDPCLDACGSGANCIVRNHGAICSCPSFSTGDPLSACIPKPQGSGNRQGGFGGRPVSSGNFGGHTNFGRPTTFQGRSQPESFNNRRPAASFSNNEANIAARFQHTAQRIN